MINNPLSHLDTINSLVDGIVLADSPEAVQRIAIELAKFAYETALSNDELRNELTQDFLTGALTNKGFETIVKPELEAFCDGTYGNRPDDADDFIITFCDLDGLSEINNTQGGHEAGNLALVDTVNILKRAVTTRGWVIRMGDKADEFLTVLPVKGMPVIEAIEKFHQNIALTLNEINPSLSFSYGSVLLSTTNNTTEAMNAADELMYSAKVNNYAMRGIDYKKR